MLVVFFLVIASCSFADDIVPHTFESGDVISADVLNEIVESIAESNLPITEDDLLGEWEGKSYHVSTNFGAAEDDWVLSEEGLYMVLDGVTITFSDDGDNTVSLSTTAPNPFESSNSDAVNSIFELCENVLYFNRYSDSNENGFLIEKIGSKKVRLTHVVSAGSAPKPFLVLQKKNVPPAKPSALSAEVDDLTVILSWTDNSNNETGFKILRKGSIKGGFNLVTTTGADAVTYQDTVPEAGRYWYRIKATNANGDSIGSKVVKVIVIED